MQDVYNSLPRATTLKFGVSPVVRSGPVFARLDLGLGFDLGPVAMMLESENATLFSEGMASRNRVTIDAFAISARLNTRSIAPCVAWVIPADQDLSDIFGTMITAGAEVRC